MTGPSCISRRTRWLLLALAAFIVPVVANLLWLSRLQFPWNSTIVWLHWLIAAESLMLWILAGYLGLLGPSNRYLRSFGDELRVTPFAAGEVLSQCLRAVARPVFVIWALLALSNWLTAGVALRGVPARPVWLDFKFALDDVRLLLLGPESIVHPSGDSSLNWRYMLVPVLFGTMASQLILLSGVMLTRIAALGEAIRLDLSPNAVWLLGLYWFVSVGTYVAWLATAEAIFTDVGSSIIDRGRIALASISPTAHALAMVGTLFCIRLIIKHAAWRER